MFIKRLIFTIFSLFSLNLFAAAVEIQQEDHSACVINFDSAIIVDAINYLVVLSDGSAWLIRDEKPADLFNRVLSSWKKGDEIRIVRREKNESPGKYFLKNVRTQDSFFVNLDIICKDPSKAFYIEKIDRHGYSIITRDGAEFILGWFGALDARNWSKGDRIIINKGEYQSKEDYLLINVDKDQDAWVSLVEWK
jgi:hypothetical protein